VPWSIFTNGGGDGAAFTWARDLLKKIGAPDSIGNEQVIFDWEKSEGGGGKFNPLNQGPVPGNPSLTTTGSQFGGGAADFASWDAGLEGAADYLAMPNFAPIEAALASNQPGTARAAIINSPWAASHYGGGSAFSDAALPGHASALAADGGSASSSSSSGSSGSGGGILGPILAPLTALDSTFKSAIIIGPLVLAAGAIGVYGFVRMTGVREKAQAEMSDLRSTVATGAAMGAQVAA
jgi:hypothetical protein